MPANPKYLTHSPWQRFAKISAALAGGFLVSASFHVMWASLASDRKFVWASYSYTLFLMWCTLMLTAFLFKNGWKCWAYYGGITLVFSLLTLWKITS